MEAVEGRLRLLAEGHGEGLAADAGATLAAGGKRLRPMLVLLSAGPGAGEAAIRAATAIELVHMATLVHDDVLDAAPLRRGRPTVGARSRRDRPLAVAGPPERTGKARGTDLLDGTVTLPLILARERDRSLVELGLRGLDAEGAEAVCDRIAATGVLNEVREGARRRVKLAKLALQRSA